MLIHDFAEAIDPLPYNDSLNPKLWDGDQLIPEIRLQLLKIARHFADFLNIERLNLKDITISGSNAAYGYSDNSDLDLHLIVDVDTTEKIELFDAKKNQYNNNYDIQIKGIDVELYVQDSKQEHYSAGIYSVLNNTWLVQPSRQEPQITHQEVKSKARGYAGRINLALKSKNLDVATKTMADLRRLRKAGLERAGEFSVENLAFKLLRARGQISKLSKMIKRLESQRLSLGEQ